MALALRFAARSDVGLLRQVNEDSGYAGPRLLVVCDGVGGHVAGEVASSVAVASVASLDDDTPGPDLLSRLRTAVENADEQLRLMVGGDPSLRGMGTTLTAVLRAGGRLGLVHVGDSRAYLLRDGALEQITHDHTLVQSLVDEGRITLEQASTHPQRSLILRALMGAEETPALDLSVREAHVGDRYLLCSDGLSSVVSHDTLQEVLASTAAPDQACEALIGYALRAGGPDNITAIVADVVDVETAPSTVPLVVGAAGDVRAPSRAGLSSAQRAAAALPRRPEPVDAVQPPSPRHRRWPRRLAALLALLVVLGGGGWATWSWSQHQYYVGIDDGRVAVFRGISQGVGPVHLSSVRTREDIAVDDLSTASRDLLAANVAATSLGNADAIVERLRAEAAACRRTSTSPTSPTAARPRDCPSAALPTPSATGSPAPSPAVS